MAAASAPGAHGPAGTTYPCDPLWDALRQVPDPELGISVVDMGLVVDVRRQSDQSDEGDHVSLRITYTAMGCPATEMIEEDARQALLAVPGVRSVAIEVVWDPIWTKARLTPDGRDALLAEGIAL
ncbi:MAG TPA: metal-sulfur cluster assembly factor [Ktedonobacterales bacterium]|nr:metal-sulfur cluster assembly factor [Ktedonobacterales bacterium]